MASTNWRLEIIGVAAICINTRLLLIRQRSLQGHAGLCDCTVIIAGVSRAGSFDYKFVCFTNADHIVQSERTKRDHSDQRHQRQRDAQKTFADFVMDISYEPGGPNCRSPCARSE